MAVAFFVGTGLALFYGSFAAVYLSRDIVVRFWPRRALGYTAERFTLLSWISLVPLLWAGIVYSIGAAVFHEHWFLSLLCAVLFVVCYLYWYFGTTPKHANWQLFDAQRKYMKFAARLTAIERKTTLRITWLIFRTRIGEAIKKRLPGDHNPDEEELMDDDTIAQNSDSEQLEENEEQAYEKTYTEHY
jgi:hypothetical protein